jgi:hypothetical protein
MTRLVRGGRGGATIHRRGCKRASKTVVGWTWAEGRQDSEWLGIPWLKACKVCFPPDATTIGERGEVSGATWESATE